MSTPTLLEAAEAAYHMLFDHCSVSETYAIPYEQVILDLKIAIASEKTAIKETDAVLDFQHKIIVARGA